MNFCTITPIAGLKRYGTALSKTHLVLAQMMFNEEYAEYYRTRRQAGDFLILDNGAYENTRPLDNAQFYNYIRDLDPQVVVLPDFLMSPWRTTTSASLRFLDEYAEDLERKDYRTQYMFVPQTNCPVGIDPVYDVMRGCASVLDDGRMGRFVTWVGLGRYLGTKYKERVRVAKQIKATWPHIKFHALGMVAGDLDEMKALKDVGVESIDSSAPVWRGWNAYSINDVDGWKENGTPCNFHAKVPAALPQDFEDVINANLEVIRNVIEG